MSTKPLSGIAEQKPLGMMNRWRFLCFILLVLYVHAVGYTFLEYYMPQSGELLRTSIALLLVVALCAMLLRILSSKKIEGGLPVVFLLLYTLVGIFSFLNMYLFFGSVDLTQFAIGFYRSMLPITLLFIAYFSVSNKAQAYKLFNLIVCFNTFLAIIGLITYLLGDRWIKYYLELNQIDRVPLHYGGVVRMTSVLWNPLLFGVLMALNCIMAWNMILQHKKDNLRWFVIFAISAVGTFASFTRTAWFVLLLGMVASSLIVLKKISARINVALLVSVVTIAIVLNIPLPMGHYDSMAAAIVGQFEGSLVYDVQRIEDLKVNMHRIAVYPIGYGLGTAGYAALPTRGLNSSVIFSSYVAADNNYVSIALQVGIVGLLLFILAHFTSLNQIIKKWIKTNNNKERALLGTAVGWIVGMAVGAVLLNVWEYNLLPYVVYALMGTALKLAVLPTTSE